MKISWSFNPLRPYKLIKILNNFSYKTQIKIKLSQKKYTQLTSHLKYLTIRKN